MWPVRVSLSCPEARSQILIVRSALPVANHSFVGSTATQRTQPRWPESTRMSFHGARHSGVATCTARRRFARVVAACVLSPTASSSASALEPGRFRLPAAAAAGSTSASAVEVGSAADAPPPAAPGFDAIAACRAASSRTTCAVSLSSSGTAAAAPAAPAPAPAAAAAAALPAATKLAGTQYSAASFAATLRRCAGRNGSAAAPTTLSFFRNIVRVCRTARSTITLAVEGPPSMVAAERGV